MKFRLIADMTVDADDGDEARRVLFTVLREAAEAGRWGGRYKVSAITTQEPRYLPSKGDRVRVVHNPNRIASSTLREGVAKVGDTGRVSEVGYGYSRVARVKLDGKRKSVWLWANEIAPE